MNSQKEEEEQVFLTVDDREKEMKENVREKKLSRKEKDKERKQRNEVMYYVFGGFCIIASEMLNS